MPTFQGLEQLEPRMLMSAVVPAGFVELGTYSVDTRTDTPVMTAELTPGGEYFAVASGTFKVGGQSSHIADAEWHKHPSKGWKDLTTLTGHNTDMGLDDASGRLGHWDGDLSTPSVHERATDGVYGQYFTANSSDPLALFYRDVEGQGPNGAGSTWYDDNSGSLTVKLYQDMTPTISIEKLTDGAEGSYTDDSPATDASFRITRDHTVGALTVNYSALPGTDPLLGQAGLDTDFTLPGMSVTFLDGQGYVDVVATVTDDSEVEPTESFLVRLEEGSDYRVDHLDSEIAAIVLDDDMFLEVDDLWLTVGGTGSISVYATDYAGTGLSSVPLGIESFDGSILSTSWADTGTATSTTNGEGVAVLSISSVAGAGSTPIVVAVSAEPNARGQGEVEVEPHIIVVYLLSGRSQNGSDEDDPSTSSKDVAMGETVGIRRLQEKLVGRNGGFSEEEVVLFPSDGGRADGEPALAVDGEDNEGFAGGDAGYSRERVIADIKQRAVQAGEREVHIALVGYSWGGGMLHDLVKDISDDADRPTNVKIKFTGYLDAVEHGRTEVGDAETRRPGQDVADSRWVPPLHYNVYQSRRGILGDNVDLADYLEGGPTTHPLDSDEQWDLDERDNIIDHLDIDNDPGVLNRHWSGLKRGLGREPG